MEVLTFMILFMLLTIVSSFFIVSFYEITRHYIEVQPNGKERVEGYVLKWWSRYWEYVTHIDSVFYTGDTLESKLMELKKMLPNIGSKFTVSKIAGTFLVLNDEQTLSDDEKNKMESVLLVRVKEGGLPTEFYLISDYPVYLFPSIIRKPISSCVRCMASFYGLLIWFSFNYLYNPFGWTNHKIFAFILFMIIFVVLLAKINDFIYKKTYV